MEHKQPKLGRWSTLFGGPRSFEFETSKAKEVETEWLESVNGDHVSIVFENLPGYITPAWGSDDDFLYIRRPEGAWKTKLKKDLTGRSGLLHQRVSLGAVSDYVFIGRGFAGKGGWYFASMPKATSADIDGMFSFCSDIVGLDADECGASLSTFVDTNDGRNVVQAGSVFGGGVVRFELVHKHLIFIDVAANRKIAYDISRNRYVNEFLKDGSLWLRFDGPWMEFVDVRVVV